MNYKPLRGCEIYQASDQCNTGLISVFNSFVTLSREQTIEMYNTYMNAAHNTHMNCWKDTSVDSVAINIFNNPSFFDIFTPIVLFTLIFMLYFFRSH